mmetsp:Transcript_25070/g.63130  ORF Transcript_25070/g.63130 Transcript_25070/m.63130 type:complete len:273 (-) Transcript_25070:2233-3051(-)
MSSSEDDVDFPQQQALPVAEGVPSFEGPATSAEEYLARVRFEAKQCPAVVRADLASKSIKDVASRPDRFAVVEEPVLPSHSSSVDAAWAQSMVAVFSELRMKVDLLWCGSTLGRIRGANNRAAEIPGTDDLSKWEIFSIGHLDQFGGGAFPSGHPPQLCYLRSLDYVSMARLFGRLVERFTGIPDYSSVPDSLPLWLYALAACLEKPLSADCESYFRSLFRHCSMLQTSLHCAHLQGADEIVAQLNVLMAVSGGYFGQDESLREACKHCAPE